MKNKHFADINFLLKLIISLMFLAGFFIFCYPFIADSINNYLAQQQIQSLDKLNNANQRKNTARLQKLFDNNKKRTAENQQLGISPIKDILGRSLKNVAAKDQSYYTKHALGSIFIPKISVSLPVFDTTSENLLEKGITLLPGSSYPVGGKGTRAVLLGHSGLPDQRLFTYLSRLKKGDKFFLEIFGKRLAYQVSEIQTILPTDLDALKIKAGQDLVTLVTCTPYMINTHRLLVTGRRVPLAKGEFDQSKKSVENFQTTRLYALIALGISVILLFAYFLYRQLAKSRLQIRQTKEDRK